MEDIKRKMSMNDRQAELWKIINGDLSVRNEGDFIEYIANLMEMSYMAGANAINLTDGSYGFFDNFGQKRRKRLHPINETGEVLTLARNFVKDKGLRL